MLSRLVFSSRHLLRHAARPIVAKHSVRSMSANISPDDRMISELPPPLPTLNEASGQQEASVFDPKTQSLEEFLNIRFGPEMATINDDKSPSRDTKNFPRIGAPTYPERTRLYILPNSWFEAFYEKTGVTGPYAFFATFGTFLLSKEIFIIEHEFFTGICLAIMTVYASKTVGPKVRTWYCSLQDETDKAWDDWQNGMKSFLQNIIKSEVGSQEMAHQQKILFDAKRENIKLQLEAEFRRRQMQVYSEVRNRLEFLLAKQAAERQYQQQHMVNWIIDNVQKSIAAQSDKDVIQKCLADLKQLATKHQISLT